MKKRLLSLALALALCLGLAVPASALSTAEPYTYGKGDFRVTNTIEHSDWDGSGPGAPLTCVAPVEITLMNDTNSFVGMTEEEFFGAAVKELEVLNKSTYYNPIHPSEDSQEMIRAGAKIVLTEPGYYVINSIKCQFEEAHNRCGLSVGALLINVVEPGDSSVSTTTPPTPTTFFSDVSADAYYADAVSWAVSKAITNGTSTTAFSPEENCTQAQILTFLWRASGKPTLNLGVLPTWVDEAYQEAVLWAAYKNMIDIVTFDPDKPCTRSTAVSYIWQALDCPSPTTSARFSDVSQSAAYAQAVSWAVGAGVTNGTSTTTFSPSDTCTRGQIVTFLYRAMG